MNTSSLQIPCAAPAVAWWKVPHMWLVVGGPAVVVVAAIITAIIAVKGADPVLHKEAYERDLKAASERLQGQTLQEALIKLQPAHQARTHAASPVVPSEK